MVGTVSEDVERRTRRVRPQAEFMRDWHAKHVGRIS